MKAEVDPRLSVREVGSGLAYLYLLRVPLLTWAVLVVLPWIALPAGAPAAPLFRGFFDIVDPNQNYGFFSFTLVSLAGLMVAAAIAVAARLIVSDGAERFDVAGITETPGLRLLVWGLPLLVPISITAGVWWLSAAAAGIFSALIGTALGIAFFFAVMRPLRHRLWREVYPPPGTIPTEARPDAFRVTRLLFHALTRSVALLLRVFRAFVRRTPEGFVDPVTGRLRARHVFALFQFLFSLLLYAGLFVVKLNWTETYGPSPRVPTLCLVLVLAMLLCWGLTGLTFTFDRYRVPLVTLLLAYGTLVSAFPQGDHFFLSIARAPGEKRPEVRASDALGRRAGKPAVVVAAEGGGIQAAAWTARVLAGLHQDATVCGYEFDTALVAVSAVSGGSVGAMYVVDAFERGHLPQVGSPDESEAVKSAERSTLDELAWGLVYPDLVWTMAPFLRGVWLWPPHLVNGPNLLTGRGNALENAWKRNPRLAAATLDSWRRDLAEGTRPAIIFNATIAETGARMLLATTTFDAGIAATSRQEFARVYEDSDLQVTTAARLSATFPYVTPPARIKRETVFDNQFHLVDGGYYDNYGTATLIEWLEEGLSGEAGAKPSEIVLVQIRSSPATSDRTPDGRRGWVFEITQPLRTMLAVRTTGQLSHGDISVHLMENRVGDVPVKSVVIQFPTHLADESASVSPPLSWHLTARDRGRLSAAWKTRTAERRRVRELLTGSTDHACIS